MKDNGQRSQKIFPIVMTQFSHQQTFKKTEESEFVSTVNYITAAIIHSDVKVFLVSFSLYLSLFLRRQTYCDVRMLDWKIVLALWF